MDDYKDKVFGNFKKLVYEYCLFIVNFFIVCDLKYLVWFKRFKNLLSIFLRKVEWLMVKLLGCNRCCVKLVKWFKFDIRVLKVWNDVGLMKILVEFGFL